MPDISDQCVDAQLPALAPIFFCLMHSPLHNAVDLAVKYVDKHGNCVLFNNLSANSSTNDYEWELARPWTGDDTHVGPTILHQGLQVVWIQALTQDHMSDNASPSVHSQATSIPCHCWPTDCDPKENCQLCVFASLQGRKHCAMASLSRPHRPPLLVVNVLFEMLKR